MLSVYKTANEASPDYESTQFFLSPKGGGKDRFNFFLVLQLLSMKICQRAISQASEIPYSPQWRSSLLVCGCKGTTIFPTGQMFRALFSKKMRFFMLDGIKRQESGRDTLLNITRAKGEGQRRRVTDPTDQRMAGGKEREG